MMTFLVTLGLPDLHLELGWQMKNSPVETNPLHSSLVVALSAFLVDWKPVVFPVGKNSMGNRM